MCKALPIDLASALWKSSWEPIWVRPEPHLWVGTQEVSAMTGTKKPGPGWGQKDSAPQSPAPPMEPHIITFPAPLMRRSLTATVLLGGAPRSVCTETGPFPVSHVIPGWAALGTWEK